MTFKKGKVRENKKYLGEVSYGLERWWLVIVEKFNEFDINKPETYKKVMETTFKTKKEAIAELNYQLDIEYNPEVQEIKDKPTLEIPIYYTINKGKVLLDIDSMFGDLEEQIKKRWGQTNE